MNVKSISRTVGLILLITGAFQIFPLLIAVIDREPKNILAYVESLCLILLVGGALVLFSRGGNRMFSAQEGFAATGLSWIFMSAFGALPFFLSGQIPSYVDAFFEMVSGFTTTGASILTDVEALSRCNLFWRSFSHWLGGMGVLVRTADLDPPDEVREVGVCIYAERYGALCGKLRVCVLNLIFRLHALLGGRFIFVAVQFFVLHDFPQRVAVRKAKAAQRHVCAGEKRAALKKQFGSHFVFSHPS